MLIDWLSREGGIVLSWWALVTLAGVAALPLCLRLLGGLPDRGYTLARSVGLLVVGFVFWLLASLGFLRNTPQNMMFAWLIVLLAGLVLYFGAGSRIDLRAWWRENNRVVIVGEILFFALLLGWSIYRAHQNGLSGTEKPMELAFMSATMRSEVFPPADPWLSGYAISYYYFGYVIVAMLSLLSGVSSTIGFNMTNALLFALTGLTVFGVVYNLVRASRLPAALGRAASGVAEAVVKRRAALLTGVLAAVFVILMSNFEMIFVEIPYQTRTASSDYLRIWNLNGREVARPGEGSGDLSEWEFWWWWHGARVISDRNLDGMHNEVIDEFPQFSFLLSDNHPHVLALPFAALALGLALNVVLRARKPNGYEIIFYGICLGGLIFLNTWDGPIYMIVLVAAEALRRLTANATVRLHRADWLALAWLGARILAVAVALYFPFLIAFRSQAAGIAPNLLNPTMPGQFFLVFGPFILLLIPFLAVEAWRARSTMNWGFGIKLGLALLGGLVALMLLLSLFGYLIPEIRTYVDNLAQVNGGWATTAVAAFSKRIAYLPTALLLLVGIVAIVGRLFPRRRNPDPLAETTAESQAASESVLSYSSATGFALLVIAAGLVLVLVPEFVYLRDNFGSRMNTIFKFYYQAWLMLSIGAAYGVYSLLGGVRLPSPAIRVAFAALTLVVTVSGLLYGILGVQTRMFYQERVSTVTLDGGGTVSGADDYLAALCLGNLVQGTNAVLVSAVGGSYNWPSGAVSTYTGIPTLLNWPGHEAQWRGSTYGSSVGSRESDIQRIYTDPSWSNTLTYISKYDVDYIVFGAKERTLYSSSDESKFLDNLEVACESGSTRIYRVTDQALMQVVGE